MRKLVALALCLFGAAPGLADAVVPTSLHCLSLRFSPATAKLFGQTHTLGLSQTDGDPANGELRLLGQGPATHGGYLRYEPPDFTGPYFIPFALDVPGGGDANGNSFADFFEISQGVSSLRTSGQYEDPLYGTSELRATWSRAAGAGAGTCVLELPNLGLTFRHTFAVFELKGTLSYTNAGTNLTGLVELRQTLAAANTITGAARLSVIDKDNVRLETGAWTNALGLELDYEPYEPLGRSGPNYLALLGFTGGYPVPDADGFLEWMLLVSDTRDTNANGVPDFSDPVSPARPFTLALKLQNTVLTLTIRGEKGRRYQVQNTPGLGQPNWTTQLSVTLTSDTQSFSLSRPTQRTTIWRAFAP